MAREERFKKYQEAGAEFLETARARAEEFLRELSRASSTTRREGRDALDDLLEGSRKGTEALMASIRKEIAAQLSAVGIATKEDLAALERKLSGSIPRASASPAPGETAAARRSAAKKAGPSEQAGSPSDRPAKPKEAPVKSTAKKFAATKKAPGRS